MEMFNIIVSCFSSIYEVMNTISVFGICSLWTFCICLIVVWCLISAYMAFVVRPAIRQSIRDFNNPKKDKE